VARGQVVVARAMAMAARAKVVVARAVEAEVGAKGAGARGQVVVARAMAMAARAKVVVARAVVTVATSGGELVPLLVRQEKAGATATVTAEAVMEVTLMVVQTGLEVAEKAQVGGTAVGWGLAIEVVVGMVLVALVALVGGSDSNPYGRTDWKTNR
jgi:hypothetical protein